MEIFSKYLDGFIYYEFEKYYLENEDKSDIEICEGFVKKQRAEANESEQVYYYKNYLWYRYRIYSNEDNTDKAIIKLLQLAIYEVNMHYFKNLCHRLFFVIGDIHEALKSIDENDVNRYYDIAFDEFKLELFKKHKNEVKEFIIDYLKGKDVYLS